MYICPCCVIKATQVINGFFGGFLISKACNNDSPDKKIQYINAIAVPILTISTQLLLTNKFNCSFSKNIDTIILKILVTLLEGQIVSMIYSCAVRLLLRKLYPLQSSPMID